MINWRRFFSRKQNWLALFLILSFAAVALAAPWLAPPESREDPSSYKAVGRPFDRMPQPPGGPYPLGTTVRRGDVALDAAAPGEISRPQLDIYYTLIWGTRSAFRIGLTVTGLTAIFGVLVGLVSGYAGGIVNGLLMRLTDAFLAFPVIAGVWLFDRAIFSQITLGSSAPTQAPPPLEFVQQALKLDPIMMALIAFSWMPYARIMNSMVIQQKGAEYVVAARSIGAGGVRIAVRHLLPNAIAPAVVLAARDVGGMVILVSAFTFIGLGGSAAWGVLLVGGRDYIIGIGGNPLAYWWVFVPVALALILFGVGWNLLGDGLNSMLNPRTARR